MPNDRCLQENGCRHLATTVNTNIEDIFGIKLKVEPRTTVRNDPSSEARPLNPWSYLHSRRRMHLENGATETR